MHIRKTLPRVQILYVRLRAFLAQVCQAPTDKRMPPLSDHLARDIGLSPAERERANLRLPSATYRHPYL